MVQNETPVLEKGSGYTYGKGSAAGRLVQSHKKGGRGQVCRNRVWGGGGDHLIRGQTVFKGKITGFSLEAFRLCRLEFGGMLGVRMGGEE